VSDIAEVTFWDLVDFGFNPAVIIVTLGRSLFSNIYLFMAMPFIYLFGTQVYPSIRPPDLPPSKYILKFCCCFRRDRDEWLHGWGRLFYPTTLESEDNFWLYCWE
jgi:hypothetical protein